jgi:hypothetical protein
MCNLDEIDIDLLLRRLESDYPTQYNYKILREAAAVIRFYREESEDGDR